MLINYFLFCLSLFKFVMAGAEITSGASHDIIERWKNAIETSNIKTLNELFEQHARLVHGGEDSYSQQAAGLMMALQKGDTEVVEVFLQEGHKDLAITMDNAPIRYASSMGHTDIVELLLTQVSSGVDPAAKDNEAIRYASANGHYEVVKLLLGRSGVNPAADNNYAIRHASLNGHIDVFKLLFWRSDVDPYAMDNKALQGAVKNGHTEIVRLLLSRNCDATVNDHYPILTATEFGYTEIVEMLLETSGVRAGIYQNEPLKTACKKGYTDIVRLLLARHDVDAGADNNEPLEYAAKYGHSEIVKLLIGNRYAYIENPWKIFLYSAEHKDEDLLKFLMDQSEVDSSVISWTFNNLAVSGNLEALQVLVKLNERDALENIDDAILESREAGHIEVARYLEGLDEAHVDLPISPMVNECAICLSSEKGEAALVGYMTFCNHQFHVACLDKWLKTANNCPLCRASI